MVNITFVCVLAIIFTLLLRWGFKTLPGEQWQIFASMPVSRDKTGQWKGVNLTYYGFFIANSYVIAVSLLFILMGSLGVSLAAIFTAVLALLFVCVPASRFMARIVEKKRHTFTIGGASFVGILLMPGIVWMVNRWGGFSIPLMPAIAAFIIAYSLGEGMGRLSCISFGCCYGKPLSRSHVFFQKVFNRYSFIFSGKTKKVSYEGGLDGVKVFPIQAITAVVYTATGLISTLLFLHSYYALAFLFTMSITQVWRVISEIFRADYRGGGRLSAYQIMAVVSVLYSYGIAYLSSGPHSEIADVITGLWILWNPAMMCFSLALWIAMFMYTGRSTVTGSTMSFYVHKDRI